MKLRHIVLFAISLLSLASCRVEEQRLFTRPQSYLDLVQAYRDGALFDRFEALSLTGHVIFADRDIYVRNQDFIIHDCSSTNRPPIVLTEEGWLVKGQQTHIPGTKGKSAEESFPVFVYLYEETLHIFASNGELLRFKSREEAEFEAQVFTVPKVFLTHSSDRIHKSYPIDGNIVIEDPDCHYSDVARLESKTTIQGRGNSTWDMPKKPFKIKLETQQKLLGMPANRDWVFLANYSDKSLLRNALGMKISSILKMDWTPRYRIVELWINGEYQGVYNVFEKKEVTKNKVNIDLAAGDCYLELEQNLDETTNFYTGRCGVPVQFKEPEIPSDAQLNSVKACFNNFENALWGSSFKDPAKGYAAYIDVDSFIDNYIIHELAKDIDGNIRKSSFLSWSGTTHKIRFCHVWDFDLSFGNANYFPWDMNDCQGEPNGPYGWWIKDYGSNSTKGNGWYDRLFQDPAFVSAVQDRWAEVFPELKRMPEYLEKLVKEMGDAPERNFKKWDILGTYVWPNVKVTGSYEGEIRYLVDFYTKRLEWLDSKLYTL